MAERYAVVGDGVVLEILGPVEVDGKTADVAERFHPEFLAACVLLKDGDAPHPGWVYDQDSGKFSGVDEDA